MEQEAKRRNLLGYYANMTNASYGKSGIGVSYLQIKEGKP